MKFCVQLLLCTALLLSGFPAQSAHNLSTDLSDAAGKSLNREVNAQASGTSIRHSNSAPETQPERPKSVSKFVTVAGTRWIFLFRGAGQPVVLIHGNRGSTQDWTRVFGPAGANYRVIAFDRPGHGRSERPKHGETTVEVQARLLHDALQQLHIERPIVVGHSWGGALALIYAITYPKEVSGAVLLAPPVYDSEDGDVPGLRLPAEPVR